MHKLLTAGVALLALGLSVPAQAADMPVKYVAPAPVFTWTGCYVGVHIGYKWGTSSQTYGGQRNGVPNAFLAAGTDLTGDYNVNGPVGGAQGGCNYQTGLWVWGVEVDGAWSSASGQASPTAALALVDPNASFRTFTTNERWLSTARGRLGWAADRWMWYVTGGAAWSGFDVNNDLRLAANGGFPVRQPTRVNKTGWIVGVGTEYALLGGWSVKSELLYANFGTLHYGDEPGVVNGCVAVNACYNADVKMHEYIWRVGMNYRFDWASWGKGKAPAVVAKY
jgi:outer membrane immunogenic protein